MRHNFLSLLVLVMLITVSILPDFTITSTVQAASFPPTISFNAKIRDFKTSHPDFENPNFLNAASKVGYGPTLGLVAPTLDKDKKPVFAGIPKQMITSANSFSQWYRDVPGVNTPISYEIVLNHIGDGVYNYTNLNFFPINNRGFGNYSYTNKNYHFTTEIQSKFVYNGGEIFKFNGDDDLWVFIDNKLVIDIGGVHEAAEKQVNLDTLGLVKGRIYDFRMFHAERQTTRSTFAITTSIAFYDQDDYEMSINAKTANGKYSKNIIGYIGQAVELEYRIPTQKINLPEGKINLVNLSSNFQSFIPPGIEVTDWALLTKTTSVTNGVTKTQLTGTDNFGFAVGKDPVTGDYRVEELVITVVGRLVETGTHNITPEDTSVSYTLNYTCDEILGQKVGNFKVASNVQIKVEPFKVEISGPDSLIFGQRNTYTATLSVAGISNPVFEWSTTEDSGSIQIIDQKTLNGVSTVQIKGNRIGKARINVMAYSRDFDKFKATANKNIDITWTIDIN